MANPNGPFLDSEIWLQRKADSSSMMIHPTDFGQKFNLNRWVSKDVLRRLTQTYQSNMYLAILDMDSKTTVAPRIVGLCQHSNPRNCGSEFGGDIAEINADNLDDWYINIGTRRTFMTSLFPQLAFMTFISGNDSMCASLGSIVQRTRIPGSNSPRDDVYVIIDIQNIINNILDPNRNFAQSTTPDGVSQSEDNGASNNIFFQAYNA